MRRRRIRPPGLVVVALALVAPSCRSHQQILEDQQKALASLTATVTTIGDAWVSGKVSARYARTSLEAAQQLLSRRRDELGSSPKLLADPSLAAVSQAQEALSRRIALIWSAVDRGDTAAARAQLETAGRAAGGAP